MAVGLLTQQITRAQGTFYVSNLGQSSTGSEPVGSDSWYATLFRTGTSISGYTLDSIQLGMTEATGNPSGFTVMLYSSYVSYSPIPGVSLGTLDGSANPSTAGIYTYTPVSSLTLSSDTEYFIVLTAGTAVANGVYNWSLAGVNPIIQVVTGLVEEVSIIPAMVQIGDQSLAILNLPLPPIQFLNRPL